jgi:hypothetical protein
MPYISVLPWLSQNFPRESVRRNDAAEYEDVESSKLEASTLFQDEELGRTSIESPQTPEGLKPRRCLENICEELGLESKLAFDLQKVNSISLDRFHDDVFDKFVELQALNHSELEVDKPYGVLPLWLSQSESWGSNFVSSQDPRSLDEYYRLHHASSTSQQRSYYHDSALDKVQSWDSNLPRTAVGATVVAIENPVPHRNCSSTDSNFLFSNRMRGVTQLDGMFRCDSDSYGRGDGCSIEASPSSRVQNINNYPKYRVDNQVQTSFTSASNTIRISHAISSEENNFIGNITTENEPNHPIDSKCHILKEQTNRNGFEIATRDHASKYVEMQQEKKRLDTRLRNLKATTQRRALDDLVFSIVQRLKDDKDLVIQVRALPSVALVVPCVIEVEKESILKGYSSRSRVKLTMIFDSFLKEIYKGISVDEYFLSSAEQFDGTENMDRHRDLIDALLFCKGIVNMCLLENENSIAVNAATEQGRWKFLSELRSLIGICPNTPSQPSGRRSKGEDISYNSIPFNADTPMTSNVSVATTLTSTFEKNGSKRFANVDGLQLRFVLSTFLSIVDSISIQLNAMLLVESENVIVVGRAIKRIKADYLQICKLDRYSLRNIAEGFEFKYRREFTETFGLQLPSNDARKLTSRASSNNSTISSNKSTISNTSVNLSNDNTTATIRTFGSRRDRHAMRRGNRFSLKRFL